jgi:CTP synthase
MTRYIFVCGGVMSGIGKGVTTASIARILKSYGFKVTAVKIDPYLNVDAGTMNPIEHGEVFVTEDGIECDQDIGNYERFLDEDIPKINYMTSGSVYLAVINKERALKYEGKQVQVVPHIPQQIISQLKKASENAKSDFTVVEIGGTVGEYENILFLEAARMMRLSDPKNVIFILVSYLPIPETIGEMKTKPTQHAVRAMNAAGLQPDMIIARSSVPMDSLRKKKLMFYCNLAEEDVISAPDTNLIYEVPLNFEKDKLGERILKKFNLKPKKRDLSDWKREIDKIKKLKKEVRIGIVGKYFETGDFTLLDSYISVIEAIKHSSWNLNKKPKIFWLNADKYEKDEKTITELKNYDGIIVPGGFGSRGVEGKIKAIKFCRENKIPFLGLCYGMQLAVIEFARNVCGLKEAHTTEVNPKTPYPVIHTMEDQVKNIKDKKFGGSMRLGSYQCVLKEKSKSYKLYGKKVINERHRHRYELNNKFRDILEKNGLKIAGINTEKNLVEIIEIENHPFFIGTQFHPEFKSRFLKPHPLYKGFIKAAINKKRD